MRKFKIAGLSFDHMHMGDLLRQVHEHPQAEICGIFDDNPANAEGVQSVVSKFDIPAERVFTDYRQCLETTQPDIVILCPATARHAEWVEKVAPYGLHVLVEKPFASSLPEADRMIAAIKQSGQKMVINWPLAWYPPHLTSKRLIDEGAIGDLIEVHYYDGNRGPMHHVADKEVVEEAEANRRKSQSWFYRKSEGGGSLQDYLGYGTTLATWFHNGDIPLEVISMVDEQPGLEVDEHSVTVVRYAKGLSKFETRWGTFRDPWIIQPQPKCGFILVGTRGTISSYDYENTIRVQTEACPEGQDIPVDVPQSPLRSPIEHFLDVIENGSPIHGPLNPTICRIGQQIVDAAVQSSQEKRAVPLPA